MAAFAKKLAAGMTKKRRTYLPRIVGGHAALRCLLRVTADDLRQRYSAPVSGILAPQRVSNVRIVTKL